MPEGPEVFYYTKRIANVLVGADPVFFTLHDQGNKYSKGKYNDIRKWMATPHVITRVYSVGKNTFIQSDLTLRIKYGLTGCIESALRQPEHSATPPANTRMTISATGGVLYFTDPLNFGDLTLMTATEAEQYISTLGPDVMDLQPTPGDLERFITALQLCGNTKPVAELLDTPNCIAGIGNYMRAEILYEAGLAPLVRVRDLKQEGFNKLYNAVLSVRDKAVQANKNNTEYPFRVYRNPEASSMVVGRGKLWYFPNK